ncbi:hypothetical protein [Paraburkholderia hospita]|uniref:hypothetical protein n=1 Tax=Paraburkholderia hospita TaxID=169430 RepID=UPI000B34936C|nr:hypothetical protein [Paraburkholderia hospita]OUL93275.1 hypothetical protein CA601_10495 [Paraburkholderia hospita]
MSERDELIHENKKLRENLKWAETGAFLILAVCLSFMNMNPGGSSLFASWRGFLEAAVIWGLGKFLIWLCNRKGY